MKIKGVVVRRDADTFTVRDLSGVDTIVRLTDHTSVKSNGGFLRSGTNYGQTNILRGLNLEVEGRGGSNGELNAEKIRFNESDLRTARSVEARAVAGDDPVGAVAVAGFSEALMAADQRRRTQIRQFDCATRALQRLAGAARCL